MKEEDIRLDQTKKVFKVLADLIQNKETCSYRYLIYDLLKFDDYLTLIDGMTITNYLVECNDLQQRIDKAIEYIENLQKSNEELQRDYNKTIDFGIYETDNLLSILRGEDNE